LLSSEKASVSINFTYPLKLNFSKGISAKSIVSSCEKLRKLPKKKNNRKQ
jgi:hypothetical protein